MIVFALSQFIFGVGVKLIQDISSSPPEAQRNRTLVSLDLDLPKHRDIRRDLRNDEENVFYLSEIMGLTHKPMILPCHCAMGLDFHQKHLRCLCHFVGHLPNKTGQGDLNLLSTNVDEC